MGQVHLIVKLFLTVVVLIWTIIISINPSFKITPLGVSSRRLYFQQQAVTRIENLKNITSQDYSIYKILVPEVECPNLVRVGSVADGGKWVCNPKAMPQSNCSIFSLGLNNEVSFDVAIQEFNDNRCKIYGYDMGQQSLETMLQYSKINGRIHKLRISNRTNAESEETTIEGLLLSKNVKKMEMLKMDVEGIEHSQLPPFLRKYEVCQIFLEAHGSPLAMRKLLSSIGSAGYLLFAFELNGLGASEFSFIKDNCMQQYGAKVLARYLHQTGVQVCNTSHGFGICNDNLPCRGKDLICDKVSVPPVCCPHYWGPQ